MGCGSTQKKVKMDKVKNLIKSPAFWLGLAGFVSILVLQFTGIDIKTLLAQLIEGAGLLIGAILGIVQAF